MVINLVIFQMTMSYLLWETIKIQEIFLVRILKEIYYITFCFIAEK